MINSFFRWIRTKTRSRVIKKAVAAPEWLSKFRRFAYSSAGLALIVQLVFMQMTDQAYGWPVYRLAEIMAWGVGVLALILFLMDSALTYYFTYPKQQYFRSRWIDGLIVILLVFQIIPLKGAVALIGLRHLLLLIRWFSRSPRFSHLLTGVRLNTARIVVLSFAVTILLGTILLTLPAATADHQGAGWIDALFTATSATCVTGLIVQDTPVYFSMFGQLIVLILIQIGGLGIMTYSAFIALLMGRLSFSRRQMMQEMLDEDKNVLGMILFIFKMTFVIEALGAAVLFSRWYFVFQDVGQTLYFSVFHSVSAFCNAGFSLFSDSLMSFSGDPVINGCIMLLIVLGGIGFLVIYDCANLKKLIRWQISLHSKVVLITSLTLIIFGFFVIFFFEFDHGLAGQTIPGKIQAALFQSVTARTAGFNTIAISNLKPLTLTLVIGLMFIGASPGSTGGGIKTSTFAILLLNVRSHLQNHDRIDIGSRTIPNTAINKAFALFVMAIGLVVFVFCLLLISQSLPYLELLFETVSAFATVGLSTGVTAKLTGAGKIYVILLMYLGRIGPLTFGLAMSRRMMSSRIGYPTARLYIG